MGLRLNMGLHPALDEARWFFVVFASLFVLWLVASFFPWEPRPGRWFSLSLYVIMGAAMATAYGVIALDAWRRRRARANGVRCVATIVSTGSTSWCSGSGGKTFRVTLRYTVNGVDCTSTRPVRQEVARRCSVNKEIEVAVMPDAPLRWYAAE